MKHYDVVIIGAGTSGLTARREVEKKTKNYLVIDDGPMGTTCARVGCMPSKVLIQVANDFYQTKKFSQMGITGYEHLKINSTQIMNHVRSLRDRFVRGVKNPMKDWESHLVQKRAKFIGPNELQIGDDHNKEIIKADKIIIATGSSPIIPDNWKPFSEALITTDSFFELESLPESIVVIGLGVIGIEIGQALSHLGVKVIGVNTNPALAGISDPDLQKYVGDKLSKEFPIYYNGLELLEITKDKKLKFKADGQTFEVDKALVSIGRSPNIKNIGLENLNITLDLKGLPSVDRNTMKLNEAPHIFLPGDANADRPILHEAADEGIIAGHNAVNEEICFKRRVFLGIAFSDPNIAAVGRKYDDLIKNNVEFVTGAVSFEGQGRSIVKLKEQGLLHVYADKQTHKILGAELQAPDGEHLAHLLAWAISLNLTVEETIRLPFYHPVVEEGLRTALRDAHKKLVPEPSMELFRCTDPPIR
jgi:dihydrolipoamide dehydrogenase